MLIRNSQKGVDSDGNVNCTNLRNCRNNYDCHDCVDSNGNQDCSGLNNCNKIKSCIDCEIPWTKSGPLINSSNSLMLIDAGIDSDNNTDCERIRESTNCDSCVDSRRNKDCKHLTECSDNTNCSDCKTLQRRLLSPEKIVIC